MTSDDPVVAKLLAPLPESQQALVDLVANAFVDHEYEWPIFQYVEWVLDERGLDAWDVLQAFPQMGRWGYGPISWIGGAPAMKPTDETEITLTLVGMAHSGLLRPYLAIAFALLDYMAEERKTTRPSARVRIDAIADSEGFAEHWGRQRRLDLPHSRLIYQLLEREPSGSFGSRGYQPDAGKWTRSVAREHLEFAGISGIEDYVARIRHWLIDPEPPTAVLSSPRMSLPSAIDQLDDVWRVAFGTRLFDLRGAERIASLDADVTSRDEFAARLSALCDLLRRAANRLNVVVPRKARNRPLAAIEAALKAQLSDEASSRIQNSLAVLEAVISLRDSREHPAASHRSLEAGRLLGLPEVVTDWPSAWQIVVARTVQSLGAVLDELRATLD